MEGSLEKKIRTLRAEAEAVEQAALEAAVPAPPGMSIQDIEEAEPVLVRILEDLVFAAVQKTPKMSQVQIVLADAEQNPTKEHIGEGSAWWSAICAWALAYNPDNSSSRKHYTRYCDFLLKCCALIVDMWNRAHPELKAFSSATIDKRLIITLQ